MKNMYYSEFKLASCNLREKFIRSRQLLDGVESHLGVFIVPIEVFVRLSEHDDIYTYTYRPIRREYNGF